MTVDDDRQCVELHARFDRGAGTAGADADKIGDRFLHLCRCSRPFQRGSVPENPHACVQPDVGRFAFGHDAVDEYQGGGHCLGPVLREGDGLAAQPVGQDDVERDGEHGDPSRGAQDRGHCEPVAQRRRAAHEIL